ncbi:uncharacterized protein LOC133184600 [Saccostrea echinata]|uniref:uncharacterized protein LOC133184600 n=1 Tax=Saccostrea echinata TaxID=191078 RepID=UPI002A7F2EEB|nr:uncharacterized protein LOC133184600 [Saccostrea echinata]
MARRVNPGITINEDRYPLAALDVNFYEPRFDYTREEIEHYFISPRRQLVSRFAWSMGVYDEPESDEDQPSTSTQGYTPPELPEVPLHWSYFRHRYIGHDDTFTGLCLDDTITEIAVNSLTKKLVDKDLLIAFCDAADVPEARKAAPKKPNFLRRILRRCFGRCFGQPHEMEQQ